MTQCGCERVRSTTASRVRPLVEAALLEERGERALALADRPGVLGLGAQEVVDRADDRRGVDPAGEAGADRDVAAQPQPDRVEEELAHRVGRVARRLARLERPVAVEPQAALVDDERVRGRQLADAGEERVVGVVDVALLEVVAHRREVRLERSAARNALSSLANANRPSSQR